MARLLVFLLALLLPLGAAAAEPLKQPGKEQLYQRVLTRPDAVIRAAPDAAAKAVDTPPPFAVLYVFERKTVGSAEWLAVGAPFAGPALGWIEADKTVAWSQQLLLAFSNPAYRLRNLFFDTKESAKRFYEDENLAQAAESALAAADAGTPPAGSGIVSVEPKLFLDINENLYLLPILDSEDYLLGGVFPANLVKIASIPVEAPPPDPTAKLQDFDAAVVFVIDTTRSMDPYIERVKDAVRKLSAELAGTPVGDKLSFGIVAFRDNTDVAPGVDYVSKVILAPTKGAKPADLEAALAGLGAATASTQTFNEDGMAGMETALGLANWDEFGGRFVIYISDAGARSGEDPLGATHKNPAEINALARERGIATLVLHLKTEAGKAYHHLAEQQYQALAAWPGIQPLYFPIENGDVAAFGKAVDDATSQIVSIIDTSLGGGLVDPAATPGTQVQQATRLVGLAMQLAYLGRTGGQGAPDLFEAWTLDRAMDNPTDLAFELRVLLNRTQINDLSDRLKALLDAATQAKQTGSQDFFRLLRTTMARFVQDPAQLAKADQVGDFLNEFLAALPYRSQILSIDEASWQSMGPAAQDEILSGIRSKLAAYQLLYDDVNRWTALWQGAPTAELVYPIPLALLP